MLPDFQPGRVVPGQQSGDTASCSTPGTSPGGGTGCWPWSRRSGWSGCWTTCSRRTGCCRLRHPGASPPGTATTRSASRSAAIGCLGRLRTRRIHHQSVRREFQLARARSGCRSTCCWWRRCATTTSLRRARSRWNTRPGRASGCVAAAADDISRRLTSIFLPGPDGRRPVHGWYDLLATDPRWRDNIPFHEYFHGDTGWAWVPSTRPAGPRWSRI